MIGRTLSHYKVLEKLGSGGMGDVYVAEDTKLSRKVALKVLPPEMASEERLMRFEREAKAVAALDHPNIVTIYSVEESDGVHFITMQLVRGKTLSELISKKGLPLNKFLEIAIPLADAVSAAHEKGITHRDLKPDNLMVSDEGRLKILDFGLAKLKQEFAAEGLSELPTQSPTQEGRILGTVAYMSPEQAEGKQIDHRSDIFSIGIILYEMATGQRPFQGDTTASMLSSILRDTPTSATELNPDLPRDIGRITKRCLSKDPERRYQTAKDVRNELEELKADVDSGEVFEGTPSRQHAKGKPWLFAVKMLVLVLALTGTLTYFLRPPAENVLRLTNPMQLTVAVGVETEPSWSPEGGRLAYASNQSGNWDIWVSQLGGGPPVNLTADHTGWDRNPSWSPDGSRIAFYSEREGWGYFIMPALGGPARKVIAAGGYVHSNEFHNAPLWSSEGKRLVGVVREGADTFAEIVSLETGSSERVLLGTASSTGWDLSWSPDERFFSYVYGFSHSSQITQIRLLRVSDGTDIAVTDGRSNDRSPSWSEDSRFLYFVSNRGGSMDLWRQTLGDDGTLQGSPARITTGVGMRSAVFSSDGSKLAYRRGTNVSNIWSIPILQDRPATWADARQLTFEQAFIEFLDLSPDGDQLIVSSDRSGNSDLWMISIEDGTMQQLTTDPTPDWAPKWSPDGKEIVFYAYRSGTREIWVMPVGFGSARQITSSETTSAIPAWSPDGRNIVFGSRESGNYDIWIVPAEGGEPRQLTTDPRQDYYPAWSPDGWWLAFRSMRDGTARIWRMLAEGGAPERMTSITSWAPAWSPDGTRIFFHSNHGTDLWNFWEVSLENRAERVVTDLAGRQGSVVRAGSPVTDGQYLYFVWQEDFGDIWVMDVVRE